MALVLASGFVGFWVALVGFLGFGLSPVVAVLIWAGSGPAGALLAVIASTATPARPTPALGASASPAA